MKIDQTALLKELKTKTEFCISNASKLRKASVDKLRTKPNPNSWSALECLEHLNIYAGIYTETIGEAMQKNDLPPSGYLKPGFVGNLFANSMRVKPNGKMTKMGAPKESRPVNPGDKTVDRFIDFQKQYLRLIEMAANKDLNKIKVPITISKWIKLKLGDALRVQVYHNERHVIQALKALKK